MVGVGLSGPQLLDSSEASSENLVKPELMTWAAAFWQQWSCRVDGNSPLCADGDDRRVCRRRWLELLYADDERCSLLALSMAQCSS
jgi:hypothetical protein